MPTGNNRTNFVDKRHVPQQRAKDTFFDYLLLQILENARRMWGSRRGVFGTAVLQGDGTDRIKVSTLPVELLDGEGHVLILDAAAAEQIYLENALGVTYYVGARHCLIPSGVQSNPRISTKFYDLLEDSVGVSGVPDAVTDLGGTIQLEVDSVFEVGVSHAGRKVTVWLNVPKTLDESVAIERDLTVAWVGGKNVVTTVGTLGQGAVSTTAGDYAVAATGVTIRRNTDLRVTDPFAFLGSVTGAGAGVQPSAFDTSQQIDVSAGLNPTRDLAYDGGPAGADGSGRRVTVDAGALEDTTPDGAAGSFDTWWGQRRLVRLDPTLEFQAQLQFLSNERGIPIASVQPLSSGTDLLSGEPGSFAGADVVNLTRGAVNLLAASLQISPQIHMVVLEDCVQQGLYLIESFTANSLTLRAIPDAVPGGWPAGTCTVRIVIPRFVVAGGDVLTGVPPGSKISFWNGTTVALQDGAGNAADFNVLPLGDAGRVRILTARKSPVTGYAEPLNAAFVEFFTAAGSPGAKLQTGEWLGTVAGEQNVHGKLGIDFRTQVIGAGAADKYALNVRPMPHPSIYGGRPSHRIVGVFTHDSEAEVMRLEPGARLADSHRWIERFAYNPLATLPNEYWTAAIVGNGGNYGFNDDTFLAGMQAQGDVMALETAGIADGDGFQQSSTPLAVLRRTGPPEVFRRLRFYGRARLHGDSTYMYLEFGIYTGSPANNVVGFRINNNTGVQAANWELYCITNALNPSANVAAPPDLTGLINDDDGWADFYFVLDLSTNSVEYWMTGMSFPSTATVRPGGLAAGEWADKRVRPFFRFRNFGDAVVRTCEFDHLEVWDEQVLSGPKE